MSTVSRMVGAGAMVALAVAALQPAVPGVAPARAEALAGAAGSARCARRSSGISR